MPLLLIPSRLKKRQKAYIFSSSLETTLQYHSFSQLPLPDRIEWFDHHSPDQLTALYDRQSLKKFLSSILESEPNAYLRQKAIEYIGELALLAVLRREFAKDCLLDEIDTADNTYVLTARLRYLFLLFGHDPEVNALLEQECRSEDTELASEACYLLGLSQLFFQIKFEDKASAISDIEKAEHWFAEALELTENRIDARFFSTVCSFLIQLLAQQLSLAQQSFATLSQLLWERQLWGWASQHELLEHHIFQGLLNLKAIAENTTKEILWTDYQKEFSILAKLLQDLLLTNTVAMRYRNVYQHFSEHLASVILDQYYLHNLSACRSKIQALIFSTPPADTFLLEFLKHLKNRLEQQQGKTELNEIRLVAALHQAYPEKNIAEITEDVQALRAQEKSEPNIETTLLYEYHKASRLDRSSYLTGYPTADEVLKMLVHKLKHALPKYPAHKWGIFVTVLSAIVSYAYQSIVQPRQQFPHLYDPTVKAESVFQNHLYMRLTQGAQAVHYHIEQADLLGASRLDIVYREAGLTFPIEIKKSDTKTDWADIQKAYLAQIQTYVHPYDQLGILVVFDISAKAEGGPVNDFRSLFNIMKVEPYYDIPNNHPDYVVAVLIPANKVSPSQYTSY